MLLPLLLLVVIMVVALVLQMPLQQAAASYCAIRQVRTGWVVQVCRHLLV